MVEPCEGGDPSRIGPYVPLGRLGSGGFGTVYVAYEQGRDSDLSAVKVVHSHYARAPTFRFRFSREIAAIKRVDSEYVPELLDEGPDDQPPWLATELIPGLSLDRIIHRCGPLPEVAVWQLAVGIAEGLAAIHRAGLVHRDLKPQNVLLLPAGPRIIDFSLVHLAELPHHPMSQAPIATPQYAAPEQVLHGLAAAAAPADVFALGATLLFAATGHPPHDADSQPELLDRIQHARPNLNGLIGSALYPVVKKCLLRGVDARPLLPELQEEFARQAGLSDGPQPGAFARVLPPDVLTMLSVYRRELAELAPAGVAGRLRKTVGPLPGNDGSPDEPAPLPSLDPLSGLSVTTDGRSQATVAQQASAQTVPPDRPAPAKPARMPDPVGYSVVWTWQSEGWVRAPIAVCGGTAVLADLDGRVTALRADTGALLWEIEMEAAVRSAALLLGAEQPPDCRAFLGTADGGLHVIDLESGRYRTLLQAATPITGSPVAAGGRVYAVSQDGYVHALDPYAPGGREVLFRMDAPAVGAPAVTGATIVTADASGTVYAIDVTNLRLRWRISMHGLVYGQPCVVAERVYFAATDGLLRVVGVESEKDRAVAEIGVPVHAAPVHDHGRLFVGGSDGLLRAFDIGTRPDQLRPAPRWPQHLGDEVNGLAAAKNRVSAVTGSTLLELDGSDGTVRRRFNENSLITAAPTLAEGFVYIASLGGRATCLRPHDRKPPSVPGS
jgi:serine/threonine protein kinase/outer membrane protein assembly factor BamB